MKPIILKTTKLSSKTEFGTIFRKANKSPKNVQNVHATILDMVPGQEVALIKVPIIDGLVKWNNISLPWTEAKKRNLKILTRRTAHMGKPALFVGVQKIGPSR